MASKQILVVPTSAKWVESALTNWQTLIVDHAHCERKATALALRLLRQYADYPWVKGLAGIVREEMRHYELVLGHLERLGIKFMPLKAARYGSELQSIAHDLDPMRLICQCIIAAFIEARPCERFSLIAGKLADQKLQSFYTRLCIAENRHFQFYLDYAKQFSKHHQVNWQERFNLIAARESEILAIPMDKVRFHG